MIKTVLATLFILSGAAFGAERQLLATATISPLGDLGGTQASVYIFTDGSVEKQWFDDTGVHTSAKQLSNNQLNRLQAQLKAVHGKPLFRENVEVTCAAIPIERIEFWGYQNHSEEGVELTLIGQGASPCGGWDQIVGTDAEDVIDLLRLLLN